MKEQRPHNDEWLNAIHDRLADFETDAPDRLWEDLSRRLEAAAAAQGADNGTAAQAEDAGPAPQRHNTIPLWVRRTAAAAAAVVLMLTTAVVLLRDDAPVGNMQTEPNDSVIAAVTPSTTGAENAADRGNANRGEDTDYGNSRRTPIPGNDRRNGDKDTAAAVITAAVATETTGAGNTVPSRVTTLPATDNREMQERQPAEAARPQKQTDTRQGREDGDRATAKPHQRPGDAYRNAYADATPHGNVRKRTHTFTLGAYASGAAASYASRSRANGVAASVMASNDTHWEGSPLLGMLLYNRGEDTEIRIRHHQPIRAGVSFTYMINDRLGLESGITYTLLASDFRDGSHRSFYDGRQQLHYIGIPLNLKYDILRWRRFGIYGSAGILAEQCVAGTMRKKYILDGTDYRSTVEQTEDKPFQLSANLGAGLRYDFTPTVSIYAEPGISYYFDDGTRLKTVYKQRPLNFNLNVGIRFTVGR